MINLPGSRRWVLLIAAISFPALILSAETPWVIGDETTVACYTSTQSDIPKPVGLEMFWVSSPPTSGLDSTQSYNVSFGVRASTTFWQSESNRLLLGAEFDRYNRLCTAELTGCDATTTPADCCVWHSNIHSCRSGNSLCEPWVGPQIVRSADNTTSVTLVTHTPSAAGGLQTYSHLVKLPAGDWIIVAHVKVMNFECAIGALRTSRDPPPVLAVQAVDTPWTMGDETSVACYSLSQTDIPKPIGLEMSWVVSPPTGLDSSRTYNVSFRIRASPIFWTADTNRLLLGAQYDRYAQLCLNEPTGCNRTASPADCCIWHSNVHSCRATDSHCEPWVTPKTQVQNDNSTYTLVTHTPSISGGLQTYSHPVKLPAGDWIIIAHVKVMNFQCAIGATRASADPPVVASGQSIPTFTVVAVFIVVVFILLVLFVVWRLRNATKAMYLRLLSSGNNWKMVGGLILRLADVCSDLLSCYVVTTRPGSIVFIIFYIALTAVSVVVSLFEVGLMLRFLHLMLEEEELDDKTTATWLRRILMASMLNAVTEDIPMLMLGFVANLLQPEPLLLISFAISGIMLGMAIHGAPHAVQEIFQDDQAALEEMAMEDGTEDPGTQLKNPISNQTDPEANVSVSPHAYHHRGARFSRFTEAAQLDNYEARVKSQFPKQYERILVLADQTALQLAGSHVRGNAYWALFRQRLDNRMEQDEKIDEVAEDRTHSGPPKLHLGDESFSLAASRMVFRRRDHSPNASEGLSRPASFSFQGTPQTTFLSVGHMVGQKGCESPVSFSSIDEAQMGWKPMANK